MLLSCSYPGYYLVLAKSDLPFNQFWHRNQPILCWLKKFCIYSPHSQPLFYFLFYIYLPKLSHVYCHLS